MVRSYYSTFLELLHIKGRPYHLPREFSSVHIMTVYIPPNGCYREACTLLEDLVNDILMKHSDSVVIISGDFNLARLSENSSLYQHVTVSTRLDNLLDLVYTNVADAYVSVQLPPVGSSDHNAVHMVPTYQSKYKKETPRITHGKAWDEINATDSLRCAIETTQWNVLISDDINSSVEVVSDYLKYLVDTNIPTVGRAVYPNAKPWINNEVRQLIKVKHAKHVQGNRAGMVAIQKQLNNAIYKAKKEYHQNTVGKMLRC